MNNFTENKDFDGTNEVLQACRIESKKSSLQGSNDNHYTFGDKKGKEAEKYVATISHLKGKGKSVRKEKESSTTERELYKLGKLNEFDRNTGVDSERNKGERSVIDVVPAILSVQKGTENFTIRNRVGQQFSSDPVASKKRSRTNSETADKREKETIDKEIIRSEPRSKRQRRKPKRFGEQTSVLDAELLAIEAKEKRVLNDSAIEVKEKTALNDSRVGEIEKQN